MMSLSSTLRKQTFYPQAAPNQDLSVTSNDVSQQESGSGWSCHLSLLTGKALEYDYTANMQEGRYTRCINTLQQRWVSR